MRLVWLLTLGAVLCVNAHARSEVLLEATGRFHLARGGTMATSVQAGGRIGPGLYLGVSYEYWIKTGLRHQTIGGEGGWLHHMNPRTYWLAAAAAYYPLQAPSRSLAYQGRAAVGFKLNPFTSFSFQVGYRLAGELDLDGAFLGVGLAVHL